MHFRNTGALALLFVAACASDSAGPLVKNVGGEDGAGLAGRVLGFTPSPDSTLVSISGAQVTLVLVGDLPVDTLPMQPDSSPPVPPGDTMLWARQSLVVTLLDTVITPPDSLPPPPPPPVVGCGRSGDTVTTVTSDALGAYQVAGLAQGVYDVLVTPPEGSGFGRGYYCGLPLRSGSPTETNIYLPPTP